MLIVYHFAILLSMNNSTTPQGILVICRHAESEWNSLGIWTGLTDVNLSDKGRADSRLLGKKLQDITFDGAYTSSLKRTQQTLEGILTGKGEQLDLPRTANVNLNERDYGDLTGKNKWEVQSEIGEEAFTGIRRGWDYPVPGGETLKDVYARALPYFTKEILPRLQNGENILLVAHGNTIRALIKHFDQVLEADMANVEMPFDNILVYTFASDNELPINKELRTIEIAKSNG